MISNSDCLRANKSTMAWGVEVRVPFLDKEFLDVAMTLDPNVCDTRFSPHYPSTIDCLCILIGPS